MFNTTADCFPLRLHWLTVSHPVRGHGAVGGAHADPRGAQYYDFVVIGRRLDEQIRKPFAWPRVSLLAQCSTEGQSPLAAACYFKFGVTSTSVN